jgi:hypothetical protein
MPIRLKKLKLCYRGILKKWLLPNKASTSRINRLRNSRNSSKPPSSDRLKKKQERKDNNSKEQTQRNEPGGQFGRISTTLQKVDKLANSIKNKFVCYALA